jgi:hypothetical protein
MPVETRSTCKTPLPVSLFDLPDPPRCRTVFVRYGGTEIEQPVAVDDFVTTPLEEPPEDDIHFEEENDEDEFCEEQESIMDKMDATLAQLLSQRKPDPDC